MTDPFIVLKQSTYDRIIRASAWVEQFSEGYRIASRAVPGQASASPYATPKIILGRIADKKPDGTAWVAGYSDYVYPVYLCFCPQDRTYSATAAILGNIPNDDSTAQKIVWATNLNEATNSGSPNRARCLPGQSVLLFQATNTDGQDRWVFTCTPTASYDSGRELGLFAARSSRAWNAYVASADLPQTWTYEDERTTGPYHNVTLAAGDPNPQAPSVKMVTRFEQGDVSNLPKLHSRKMEFDHTGRLYDVGAENGTDALDETLGERVTVIVDVRLTKDTGTSPATITLEKKTQEAIVFWKGSASGWTNAGTVPDTGS